MQSVMGHHLGQRAGYDAKLTTETKQPVRELLIRTICEQRCYSCIVWEAVIYASTGVAGSGKAGVVPYTYAGLPLLTRDTTPPVSKNSQLHRLEGGASSITLCQLSSNGLCTAYMPRYLVPLVHHPVRNPFFPCCLPELIQVIPVTACPGI